MDEDRTHPDISVPARTMVCSNCSRRLPLSQFVRSSQRGLGRYGGMCRACVSVAKRRERARRIRDTISRVEEHNERMLNAFLASSSGTAKSPHLINLLVDVSHVFGGTKGFAQQLMAHVLAAKPGSMVRQRAYEMYYNLLKECSAEGYVKPFSQMEDSEFYEVGKRLGLITHEGSPVQASG